MKSWKNTNATTTMPFSQVEPVKCGSFLSWGQRFYAAFPCLEGSKQVQNQYSYDHTSSSFGGKEL